MTKVSNDTVAFLPPYRPRGPRANGRYEDEGNVEDSLESAKSGEAEEKREINPAAPPPRRSDLRSEKKD